jgi:hypothetical protein
MRPPGRSEVIKRKDGNATVWLKRAVGVGSWVIPYDWYHLPFITEVGGR